MRFPRVAFLIVCFVLLVPCSSAWGEARPPKATTLGAERFLRGDEVVYGDVRTYGMATRVRIEFGLTKAYGQTADDFEHPYGWNNGVHAEVEALAENLQPGRTYHYRLVAWNEAGTSFGADRTFHPRREAESPEPLPTDVTALGRGIRQGSSGLYLELEKKKATARSGRGAEG